jgi:micrococcal nuclease
MTGGFTSRMTPTVNLAHSAGGLHQAAIILPLLAMWIADARADHDPWRTKHSCLSAHGSYVCGDSGHRAPWPDNDAYQGSRLRLAGQRTPQPAQPLKPQTLKARVVQIIDGDTIEVAFQGTRKQVRYIGVNAPATSHHKGAEPFGPEAAEANRRLVEGWTVWLEFDVQRRDQDGRLLAYVYVGDLMVNAELVRQGYAQVATLPPNVKYQDLFLKLQREAQEAKRALWGD